ncbi:MAG: GNAT family N-acetyltransferase [Roseburia sp.]|nr:GNAT family N-acetyltransferase [Roseburia sp.]
MRKDIEIRRLSKEHDCENYIRLQKEVSPFRHMFDQKKFCDRSWEDMFAEGRLPYSIIKTENKDFCGYCAIKNMKIDNPEIEIELLEKFRGGGIGYAALYKLLYTLTREYGIKKFTYCTDSDNYASQALVSKIGGRPAGLKRFFFLRENEVENFEEENMGMIDSKLEEVAVLFDVETRKLLSHVLVYSIDIDDFVRSVEMNKGKHNR